MTKITIRKFLPYHKQTWSRLAVEGDLRSIYIFTDNTDRTSGSGPIDPNSWYCKEFGEEKKIPNENFSVYSWMSQCFSNHNTKVL